MRIDHVSLTLFAWEGIPATRYHAGAAVRDGASALGLLRIGTDAGAEGHAFLGSAMHTAENDGPGLVRFLKPLLMGEDPLDRERLNAALWTMQRTVIGALHRRGGRGAVGPGGKAAGMPVHRLLGTSRRSIGAYASSARLPSAAAYAEEAQRFKANGWAATDRPAGDPRADIAVCEAVRAAVGDDYPLLLDSTWAYDVPGAMRVGRAAERLGFLWFEDPLHDQDITGYLELKRKLDIPLMATEYPAGGLESYAPWIALRATDYLRGDVAVKGGITTCVKAAHLAEAFRMGFEIHHGGNSLNNVANLHIAMAIRNTTWFEVLLPDAAHKTAWCRTSRRTRRGWSTRRRGRASATRSTPSWSRGSGSRCWSRHGRRVDRARGRRLLHGRGALHQRRRSLRAQARRRCAARAMAARVQARLRDAGLARHRGFRVRGRGLVADRRSRLPGRSAHPPEQLALHPLRYRADQRVPMATDPAKAGTTS